MSDENKTVKLSDKDKKYWSNRIDSEVSDKRQELKRAIELKVDKQIKKEYKKFVSTLKLASKLTAFITDKPKFTGGRVLTAVKMSVMKILIDF